MRIFTTAPEIDPYSVNVAAEISRKRTMAGSGSAGQQRSESWVIRPETGGEIAFDLAYTTGTHGWSSDTSFPHSAADPGFSRIYRYDQLVDLAMSKPIGKPLAGDVSFSSSVAALAGLFDGSEELLGIVSVPVYVREIALP